MQALADLVKDYIKLGKGDITVCRNRIDMGLEGSIADANRIGVDLYLSLHSNAGGSGNGTEAYYYWKSPQTNGKGKKLAEIIYNIVCPLTIGSDNGCRPDNVLYSNGLAELRETNAPAALIEIMYHDNKEDVINYLNNINKIALAIAKGLYIYLGVDYYTVPTPSNIKTYFVQVGAFHSKENALNLIKDLESKGFNAIIKEG